MSLVGSILSGNIQANAAGNASNALAQGATTSEHDINVGTKNSADFLQNQWNADQNRQSPYLDVGSTSANGLAKFLQTPFQAPTLEDARNSPGYQFELQTGADAIDQNAAATGTLNSGNTGVALQKFGTGLADSTYNDLYNRALQTYNTNFSSLFSGAQLGESATTNLGNESVPMANDFANIQMRGAEDSAQQNNDIAQARASGYLGKANAYSNMINSVAGDVQGGMASNYASGTPLWMAL